MNKRNRKQQHHTPHPERHFTYSPSNETLRSRHSRKEITKLDKGNCRTANIFYAARCKTHGNIFTSATLEGTLTNTSTIRKTDQVTTKSWQTSTNTSMTLKKTFKFQYFRKTIENSAKTSSSVCQKETCLQDLMQNQNAKDVSLMKSSPTQLVSSDWSYNCSAIDVEVDGFVLESQR